jgi:hypothetical protein
MIHAWLCLNPEPIYLDTEENASPIGVQIMMSAPDSDTLRHEIRLRLAALGMTLNTDWRTLSVRTDAEYEVYPFGSEFEPGMENPTGLRVEIFPCNEQGTNLSYPGTREPIGE